MNTQNLELHAGGRRIDIDLLRAIAVLAVMLYHFDVPGLSGGFLGVDMFFVISGYLITLHLLQRMGNQQFSFTAFYVRRIKRLYPALTVTLLLSTLVAFAVMPKTLLADFTASLVSSAAYISNVYFWTEANYFDTQSVLKPLLHTWSLSVEEQFYLFWPLFVLLTVSRRPLVFFSTIGVLSLLAVQAINSTWSSAAFYLFPFRIFEFAIGAIVSCLHLRQQRPNPKGFLAATLGLVAIACSVTLVSEETANPGLLTLPVCLGTALIIWAATPFLNRRFLFYRPILAIGLVSYSAYLIHWPLVVFYKLENPGPLGLIQTLGLTVLTLGLAALMYQLVEKPALRQRSTHVLQRRNWAWIACVPGLVAASVTVHVYRDDLTRWIHGNPKDVQAVLDSIPDREELLQDLSEAYGTDFNGSSPIPEQHAREGKSTILVIGDSHAADMAWSLTLSDAAAEFNVVTLQSICDPLTLRSVGPDLVKLYENHPQKRLRDASFCRPYHSDFIDRILAYAPDAIVFSESWRPKAIPYFEAALAELSSQTDARIFVLGRNAVFTPHPLVGFKQAQSLDQIDPVATSTRSKAFDPFEEDLRRAATQHGAVYISKVDVVCPNSHCEVLLDDDIGYVDGSHWSKSGMHYYGSKLWHQMSKELTRQ